VPTYTFKRTTDGALFSKRLSFTEYESVKTGESSLVDDEGNALEIVFNPGTVGFVLKDGVSGGWMSKANKENKFRRERGSVMAQKEKDHVFKSRLVPNYQGQEAHSWADVQDHVRSTKGAEAASTYAPLVSKERTS
jgi:hypothetical protein